MSWDKTNKATPLFDMLPSCEGKVTTLDPVPQAFLDDCKFTLCDGESFLFQCWASEHIEIAGVEIEMFHLDLEGSERDPLYDEAIERVFQGSYRMKAFVEYPESTPEATESGLHATWDASVWIPTAQLIESGAPAPAEGDVIRFWDKNNDFFRRFSVLEQDIPGSGYFFDIIKADEDGHLFDQATFLGFKCALKRKTEFTAERRMAND